MCKKKTQKLKNYMILKINKCVKNKNTYFMSTFSATYPQIMLIVSSYYHSYLFNEIINVFYKCFKNHILLNFRYKNGRYI